MTPTIVANPIYGSFNLNIYKFALNFVHFLYLCTCEFVDIPMSCTRYLPSVGILYNGYVTTSLVARRFLPSGRNHRTTSDLRKFQKKMTAFGGFLFETSQVTSPLSSIINKMLRQNDSKKEHFVGYLER